MISQSAVPGPAVPRPCGYTARWSDNTGLGGSITLRIRDQRDIPTKIWSTASGRCSTGPSSAPAQAYSLAIITGQCPSRTTC